MNTPKVSVIIPVYNVEPYIERCLLSALNQTYENIEIILVDDCGQDNSMTVARRVIENHSKGHKVQILKQKHNKGPSVARNVGIESAKGEYIYFLDSDDELILSAIESIMKNLSDCDIVMTAVVTSDMKPYFIGKNSILKGYEIIESFFKREMHTMTCNKFIDTKFIKNNSLLFKEGLLHEDYLWTYQIISCAAKVRVIDIPVYIYHIRANTRNTDFTLKNIKHYLYGYNIIKADVFDKYTNVPFSGDYLVCFAFDLSLQSVKKCKCTYSDYKNLNIFDKSVHYKIIQGKTEIKRLFFRLPRFVQYFILKYLWKKNL